MARSAAPCIHDVLQTIERVQGLLSGKTFADFQRDWALSFAAQRAIEIISEASRRLPEELKAAHPEIHWRRVAGIGNVLRHEYQSISDKVNLGRGAGGTARPEGGGRINGEDT
jgi:uncharacterized protein with HEPN domain